MLSNYLPNLPLSHTHTHANYEISLSLWLSNPAAKYSVVNKSKQSNSSLGSDKLIKKCKMRPAMVRGGMRNGSPAASEELADSVESPTEPIEGALEIHSAEHGEEIWRKPNRKPLPADGNPVLSFEIPFAHVLNDNGASTKSKRFVLYEIAIHLDSTEADPSPATIERRYSDFLKLYEELKKDQSSGASLQNYQFPKKALFGNFNPELVAERATAFEALLDTIVGANSLKESGSFLEFLQGLELKRACRFLDERRHECAVPILENCFRVVNKIFMDKSRPVLLLLCRLVAACTSSPIPHPRAEEWAELALRRYEHVCDTELLVLYIPLLQTCVHLWWQRGRDNKFLQNRLEEMGRKGIKVKGNLPLAQAIHVLEPRGETA